MFSFEIESIFMSVFTGFSVDMPISKLLLEILFIFNGTTLFPAG